MVYEKKEVNGFQSYFDLKIIIIIRNLESCKESLYFTNVFLATSATLSIYTLKWIGKEMSYKCAFAITMTQVPTQCV